MAAKSPEPFVPIQKPTFASDMLASMSTFQKEADLTDFKIKVNGKVIHAHKIILAASTPYFVALFSSNMKESKSGESNMDTMDYDVVHTIIQFMYGNNVEIQWENIQAMVEACELMQMNDLKKQLADHILQNISVENCIGLFKFAEKFHLAAVEQKARHVMLSELEMVAKTDAFKELELPELIDYISNTKDIQMCCQDAILIAVIEWVDYNPVSRKGHMLDVLKHLKLEECSSSTLNVAVKKYKDLFTDPDVKSLIFEAFLPKLEQAEQKMDNKLLLLGGMHGYNKLSNRKCWFNTPFSSKWEELTEIPEDSQAFQSPLVCLPDGFAVIGGGDSQTKNTKYNTNTKQWSDLPDTPQALTDARAVFCDGDIVVLDGGPQVTDIMYQLDLTTLKWLKGPNLLEKQVCPIVCSLDKTIFVVYNDHLNAKKPCTFQIYTKGSDKWQFKCSLPDAVPETKGSCLVAAGQRLYLVGGNEKINACYKPASDTWTILKSPLADHMYGSAFARGGKIFLCGGGWTKRMCDTIEEFDINKNEWVTSSTKLPAKLNFFTVAVVDL